MKHRHDYQDGDICSTCDQARPMKTAKGRAVRLVMMSADQLRIHRDGHDKFNSWWLLDAKGIELCRVCDTCITAAKATYAPEVLGERGRYEDIVEETIQAEDY